MKINELPTVAITEASLLLIEVPDGSGGFNSAKITLANLRAAILSGGQNASYIINNGSDDYHAIFTNGVLTDASAV